MIQQCYTIINENQSATLWYNTIMQLAYYLLKLISIIVFDVVGIIGAVVPAIPGPPLCLIGLVIAFFGFPNAVSVTFLIVSIVLSLIAAGLDYLAPALATKFGGGSKWAVWGSTIGLIIGFFLPPFGIIWIPLVCAFIGELIANFKVGKAFKVAFLSFLSFVMTIGFKLLTCAIITIGSIKAAF